MTVLVSGATGFLGTALLRQLDEPVVAVLRGDDFENRARTLARRAGIEVRGYRGDVRADQWGIGDHLDELRGEVRAVVNLAGEVAWSASWGHLASVNVDGARNAVDVAAALDVPLLHVASLYAGYDYAARVPEALLDERPHLTKYERSKLQGEWAVADRCAEKNATAWIVRVGALSGDLVPMPGARDGSSRVPFTRLVASGPWPVFPYAPDARLDIGPRDVVSARMAEILDVSPKQQVEVRNLCQGAAAPLIGAIVTEAGVSSRESRMHVPRPVPVRASWLRAVSSVADRVGEGPMGSALIGLRYFASSTIFESEGLGCEISLRSLVRTLGLPHPATPVPVDSFYQGWMA
jgi:nucleoside-diphosphate-sugar epimerase